MTVVVGAKKDMAEFAKEERQILPHSYGCEILLEKTGIEKAKDASFPSDAYLVWYVVDNKECLDLCRAVKKVNLFDMYYDKYGPGSVQKIDFGYGRVNPKLWGYKAPEKKKRK
jgi:hypothetical protein